MNNNIGSIENSNYPLITGYWIDKQKTDELTMDKWMNSGQTWIKVVYNIWGNPEVTAGGSG